MLTFFKIWSLKKCGGRSPGFRRRDANRVRSASYIFGKWCERGLREPVIASQNRLSAPAFAARRNQACTVCLVASEALLISKTKIEA
jgi:hypothetical protein